jgi:hypothetical protein
MDGSFTAEQSCVINAGLPDVLREMSALTNGQSCDYVCYDVSQASFDHRGCGFCQSKQDWSKFQYEPLLAVETLIAWSQEQHRHQCLGRTFSRPSHLCDARCKRRVIPALRERRHKCVTVRLCSGIPVLADRIPEGPRPSS